MSKKIQVPLGMKDWKASEMQDLLYLEKKWMTALASEGFSEIRTPVLESVDLFVRSVGEFSDIVSKEMFVIDDMVLRPEGTAPIMRSYLDDPQAGPKYFSYFAPFFRKERPQKGRFRQFYQYGCEVIGENAPQAEVSVLNMLNQFYKNENVKFRFEINFLPKEDGLKQYENVLKQFYLTNIDKVSDASKKRLENGVVLRILDSKEDAELNKLAPKVLEFLSEDEKNQWTQIYSLLVALNIKFVINPLLVRGLDYYEGFVFEVVDESNTLGSQNALGGGGRYNKLSVQLGAKESISAFGFAGGAERLLYQLEAKNQVVPVKKVSFITTEPIVRELVALKEKLKNENNDYVFDVNLDNSMNYKKMFKRCDRLKMDYVVVLGKSELEQNKYKVKQLATGKEVEVAGSYLDFSTVNLDKLFV